MVDGILARKIGFGGRCFGALGSSRRIPQKLCNSLYRGSITYPSGKGPNKGNGYRKKAMAK
jgi:hypothetical protein